MDQARAQALQMFQAAVKRADPATAVAEALARGDVPAPVGRLFVIAVGKASVPMARAALAHFEDVHKALVVTNPENMAHVAGATVMAGAHPVPDEGSLAAGEAVVALLAEAGAQDTVLALISGGGSALMVRPVDGIGLAEKAAVNTALLESGLGIEQMNLVRQQLSDLKGGGVLRHAAPASVFGLMLSDVIGDDLRAIASGPTVSPIGTKAEARDVLIGAGVWDGLPAAVRAVLAGADVAVAGRAQNQVIGSNRQSLAAMVDAAQVPARIVSDALIGDVADAAKVVLQAAEAADGPCALVFGGETTVKLSGDGLGGRNQELALRVAAEAEGRLGGDWVFLSGGTDGRDGPTDSAGGLVDSDTLARLKAAGGDLAALLENNDSYQALSLSGDHIMIGGTGTNVADVQVFLRLA